MANNIEKITIAFIKRNARLRGPTSSDAWNDQGEELTNDLNSISSKWNDLMMPLLGSLPNGTNDLDAFDTGLSGKTLYVDDTVTASDNSSYWSNGNARPNTIKEQFDSVYTNLANSIQDLQALVTSSIPSASLISIKDVGDLYSSTNVEDALQEVMDVANSYSFPSFSNLLGTTTNDNATANYVGEYIQAAAAAGSVLTWSSNTAKNITSISLSAGDWDVDGVVLFSGGAITGTVNIAKISTTTANVGSTGDQGRADTSLMPTANVNITNVCPRIRLSLSGTTTVYLVGLITFSIGTPLAGGYIRARRVR